MNQANLQILIDTLNNVKIGLIAVNNYVNVDGEKSKRRINIGFSYEKLKKDDLETLSNGVVYIESDKYTKADWDMAVLELKKSIIEPSVARSEGQSNAYLAMTENGAIRYNYETQKLYIMGLELDGSKKVVEEGTKKVVKSAPKTIAKNVIRREYLKQGLVRNFIVHEIGSVVTRGNEIELS
jgi:hypothetical protein